MGTRNLICVVKDGTYKVSQYGQWDGYPSGQGKDVLNFLRENDMQLFRQKIDNVRYITKAEHEELWRSGGLEIGDDGRIDPSFDDATKFYKAYPELSRDTAAGVLPIILNSEATWPVLLHSNLTFAADSLMCEFAYVIDLDNDTFEVFEGFNTKALSQQDRFYPLQMESLSTSREYYPVKLVRSFDLNQLPTEQEFLDILDPPDDEE